MVLSDKDSKKKLLTCPTSLAIKIKPAVFDKVSKFYTNLCVNLNQRLWKKD